MAAAAHDRDFAKRVGVPQRVAREYNKADVGTTVIRKAARGNQGKRKGK